MSAAFRARALAALLLAALARAAAAQGGFHFVALGDMPYGADSVSGPAYRHLIDLINAEQPPFAIHVGDFKDGISDCSDELYERQHAYFQRFEAALIYTPGDNDWIDCRRTGSDPLERLGALRQRFFGRATSMGQKPIAVERQADVMPIFAGRLENLRWWHERVLFVTFHTVGPENNLELGEPALRKEYVWRDAANTAWIRAAFRLARNGGARALVFATQGDPFRVGPGNKPPAVRVAFRATISFTLVPLAAASGLPVLFVHGDSHRYIADLPFVDARGEPVRNLQRLQVFGHPRIHAVKVLVDPAAPQPFRFEPIWNAQSADPRR